jgi:Fic family protein
MQVVSGPIGRERVHFEAPDAGRLPHEMDSFLRWFNGELPVDPVLKAAIARFWFVTIHPFEDRNGRIARAIADMALARADGCRERFYSMSAQIEAERREYYSRLEHQQRSGLDITGWIDWFLGCLGRAIEVAENTLSAVLAKVPFWERFNRGPVNDRQRHVVNRLPDGFKGHLTRAKYATLVKCSTDTALRDIQGLVQQGLLERNQGRGRSTSYRLGDLETISE